MAKEKREDRLRRALRNYLLVAGVITILALLSLHTVFISNVGAAGRLPSTVTASVDGDAVVLRWTAYQTNGYTVYRDDVEIAFARTNEYRDARAPTMYVPTYRVETAEGRLVGYAAPGDEPHGSLANTWLRWWRFWN